jgi:hypothetical protein
MKVSEAIALLKEADQDAELFVSSDEEGNSYRRANISFPETMCDQDGEFVSVHPDDLAAGEYEGWEDTMFPAVVVW